MKLRNLITGAALVLCCGCASVPSGSPVVAPDLRRLGSDVRQVIWVAPDGQYAQLTAWRRTQEGWENIFGPVAATIGRNGFAPEGEKEEGDGRTPSGTFQLKRAFGYAPVVKTKLSYTQATEKDFWIDDPASPVYNKWVVGEPGKFSAERLRRDDDLYRQAIIIEYNTNPTVAGAGSAIFLHIWRSQESPTSGCVAVSIQNIERLLSWLDRSQNPVILLGNDAATN